MAATQRRVSPGHDAELEAPSLSSEPDIRYARAADGASIAYWTLGRGAPLMYLAGAPWSHVELWQIPECRTWYERLAYGRRLVRFDMRGTGLSTREVADYSLEALLLDIDAVVERLEMPRFALFGAADAGPLAIAYAARHPERVSHLVLWCAWARGADVDASPRIRAWRSLLDRDWELMTETCAYLALGWSAGEIGRQAAERLRASMTREGLRAALDAAVKIDAAPMLAAVAAPSLVLYRRDIAWLPASIAREIASRLPEARLVVLDGESTAPYLGDSAEIAQAIGTFLNEPDHQQGAIRDAAATVAVRPAVSGAAPRGRALTEREIQVVRLVASGLTNEDIAEQLVLSVRTVERHVSNIYDKLGTRSRARTIAYALTNGLV